MHLHGGIVSTTTEVWAMLTASRDGNLDQVKALGQGCPALLTCEYDYTSPLHFAVREGHLNLVRYLVEQGALDPTYTTHPFLDPLVTFAEDRGYEEIASFLKRSLADPSLTHEWGDTGKIEFGKDEAQRRLEEYADHSKYDNVEAILKERPELAMDGTAFWGEGILAMPAKNGDRRMLELLMRHGARVPDVSKWGKEYYFKSYETAEFLLESGMSPNHMNWRGFTLLHDMAFVGNDRKARLLLDHGAEINAIDDDYSSTPLGYAAHWGHRDVAALLLERGADPNRADAPWATPLAWARKKGHADIESDLLEAGAAVVS
jgi:ankyrin repeat protein